MHGDAVAHRQHVIPSSSLGLQFFYECYIFDALTVDELTVDKLTVQQSCSEGAGPVFCPLKILYLPPYDDDFPVHFD